MERDVEGVRQGRGIPVGGHTPSVTTGSGGMERVVRLLKGRCGDSASANTNSDALELYLPIIVSKIGTLVVSP